MKTSSMKDKKIILISLVIILGVWILLSNKINNSIYLPKVSEICNEAFNIVKGKNFLYPINSIHND